MKLGIDLSIMDELNELHPVYKYKGEEIEPFHFFSEHNHISMVRLRLWINPYDDKGNPYGGGTNDLPCFIRLAKKANKEGMKVMLDFHYSDFWVDPSRQKLSKDWLKYKTIDEIENVLYEYTKETLLAAKKEEIDIGAIQIGNEITNGMVHPFGEISKEYNEVTGGGFKGFARLYKAGYKACKEIYPDALTLCHLEHSGSKDMQEWYFVNLFNEGVEFDVIGESYYPYWHGGIPYFIENITNLKNKFHKPIWIVEMGYEYAPSKVEGHNTYFKDLSGEEFIVGNVNGRIPFPITQEGQCGYLRKMFEICLDLGIDYIFYWEPTWILMEGNGWAKDAGQIYCDLTPVTAFNDWANATLFDFEGNATLAIDVYTQDYVDSLNKK